MIKTDVNINGDTHSFYDGIGVFSESSKNFLVKKVKKIITPLSSSQPLNFVTKIANKTLALANYFRSEPLVPIVGRALEDAAAILTLGSFTNTLVNLIPFLGKDNLDEAKLVASVADATSRFICQSEGVSPERVVLEKKLNKQIVKQVKFCLDQTNSNRDVRKELADFLVGKGINQDQASKIALSIQIQEKKKSLIERIYSNIYLIPGALGALGTLDKWKLINLADLATKLGNIPVFGAIVKIGLKPISLYSFLAATTLRFGDNVNKLYRVQIKVRQAKEGSAEQVKAIEERMKLIWTTTLCGLSLVGGLVPLILSVNPAVLITYDLFVATLGLVNVLRQ